MSDDLKAVAARALACLDLTNLNDDCTEDDVRALARVLEDEALPEAFHVQADGLAHLEQSVDVEAAALVALEVGEEVVLEGPEAHHHRVAGGLGELLLLGHGKRRRALLLLAAQLADLGLGAPSEDPEAAGLRWFDRPWEVVAANDDALAADANTVWTVAEGVSFATMVDPSMSAATTSPDSTAATAALLVP